MIKAVVFDLDDTLFPECEYVLSGFRAVDAWLEGKYDVHGFFKIAEDRFRNGARGNIFNLALDDLRIRVEKDMIPAMVSVYREHRPTIALFDDARWALDHFSGNKKLGIITDGFLIAQKNKVRALGIEDRFDIIVYTDELGKEHWKPSETPYRQVMNVFSCEGSECVYVGDNPKKDFVTARALGWLTVHVRRPSGEYVRHVPGKGFHADKEVLSLVELKNIIE